MKINILDPSYHPDTCKNHKYNPILNHHKNAWNIYYLSYFIDKRREA